MPNWIAQIISFRGLSLLIALIYLALSLISEWPKSTVKLLAGFLIVGGALVLPLACIWFGDEFENYLGMLPSPAINRKTPAWMIKLGGWVLLLLPAVIAFFVLRN